MKSLQVRDVPEHIYQKLLEESRREHRSLAQQTIASLAKALGTRLSPKDHRRELLSKIRQKKPGPVATPLRDPVELIREDREQ
jgi:hypothetical protein